MSNPKLLRGLSLLTGLFSLKLALKIEARIPRPPANITIPPGPPTAEQLLWQKKAEEARLSELDTIRRAAKDWASTITAVTGAVGTVTLIKGPDQIGTLTSGWKDAVGVFGAIAILAALRGIYLAALAAQGSPRSYSYDPSVFRHQYRLETVFAARALQVSRALVVIAALAAAAVTFMVLFGATKPAASGTRVVAVTTDGTTTCGIIGFAKSGAITISADDGSRPTTIDPAKLRALIPTGSCP